MFDQYLAIFRKWYKIEPYYGMRIWNLPKLSNDTSFNDLGWPLNPGFNVTPFLDAKYLRNGTRYKHSCNAILIGTYPSPTQGCHFTRPWMILSHLANSVTWSIARSLCDSWACYFSMVMGVLSLLFVCLHVGSGHHVSKTTWEILLQFCTWTQVRHTASRILVAIARWVTSGESKIYHEEIYLALTNLVMIKLLHFWFLSASLYVSKRGAYWDRLCRDVVGRWLVVTRVHCGQTVHPRPIVTMEH